MFSVHTTPEEFEIEGFTLKTHQMFSVHTTPEEFEIEGFTLKTHQMFSVRTTPEEFQNEGFTLKTHQMFSIHTTPEEFKLSTFQICVSKFRQGNDYDVIVFKKPRFQNVFCSQENENQAFSNSSAFVTDFCGR